MSTPEQQSFADFSSLNAVRDLSLISTKLAASEAQISKDIGETPKRKISRQVVAVKAANDPDVLARFLNSISDDLKQTSAQSSISITVIDDSNSRVPKREMATCIKDSGVPNIYHLRTQEQTSQTLLGKTRNRLIQKYSSLSKSDIRHRIGLFQYLLNERGAEITDLDVDNMSDGYISNTYAGIGHGHMSTSNIATLSGAYLLGLNGCPQEEGVITLNDDDVLYRTLRFTEEGGIEIHEHDFFKQREIQFSDPETEMTLGRYTGSSGNPLTILTSTLQVIEGILAAQRTFVPPNAPTSYPIFDMETKQFQKLSVENAYQQIPYIVESALSRTPVTGYKTSESYKWLRPDNLTILDQGNYSMSGKLARRIPTTTGALLEFTLPSLLKALYRDRDVARLIRIEEHPIHLRTPRGKGGDTYTGGLISGMMHPYSRDQRVFEELIKKSKDTGIIFSAQETFGDSGLTTRMFLDNMPTIDGRRNDKLETVQAHRIMLTHRLKTMTKSLGPLHPITVSVQRLLDACSPEKINEMHSAINGVATDTDYLRRVKRSTKRYLEATKYWPDFFDTAYELGVEDSDHSPML